MKKHPYFDCMVAEDGQVFSLQGKKYKQRFNEFGYKCVNTRDPKDGIFRSRRVHRLVAETYLPNPENKREVNHKDCDKSNNLLTNLEWVTSKENKEHAWENGLYSSFGENHTDSLLTEVEVIKICSLMEEGCRNVDIAKSFGVHKDTISSIRTGRIWKHVSKDYKLDIKRVERKSPSLVIKVAELLEIGLSDKEISSKLDVSRREINRIRNRETHSSLTKGYSF